MKQLKISALLFSGLLLWAGCPRQPSRSPAETRPPPFSERLDYVVAKDVDGGELRLPLRGGPFNAMLAEGERLEDQLAPVYFDFDKAYIRPEDRDKLETAAQHLQDNPDDHMLIEGHCDWRGTTEYNLALGDRRAREVRRYLAQIGAAEERMETVSKGDLEANEHAAEEEMRQDRRADLIIIR